MRLRIAFDLDGVTNNLVKAILKEYNERYFDNLKYENLTAYRFQPLLKPEAGNIFETLCTYSFMVGLEVAENAVEVLTRLNEQHEIYFATAGHPNTMGARHAWLKQHFPFYKSDMLIACADKRLLDVDILVDDCLEHFGQGARYQGIVYDAPYNQLCDDGNFIRVKSFPEIERAINMYERKIA